MPIQVAYDYLHIIIHNYLGYDIIFFRWNCRFVDLSIVYVNINAYNGFINSFVKQNKKVYTNINIQESILCFIYDGNCLFSFETKCFDRKYHFVSSGHIFIQILWLCYDLISHNFFKSQKWCKWNAMQCETKFLRVFGDKELNCNFRLMLH